MLADNDGSIWLDVWESHIPLTECDKTYALENVHIQVWSGVKKVSTTTHLVIIAVAEKDLHNVSAQDIDIETDYKTIKVSEIACFMINTDS